MTKSRKIKNTNSVNIANLKSKLSSFLRLVKGGQDIIVTEHKVPVAKIVKYESSKLTGLIAREPSMPISNFLNMLKNKGSGIKNFNSTDVLLEDRKKR